MHYSNADMPREYEDIAQQSTRGRAVCDYVAGMTDNFAIRVFKALFIPGYEMGETD